MLEGLELERWENVWEELVREFEEFCMVKDGKVEKEERFGEEIVSCTLPKPEKIYVMGKLYPGGDREVRIEPEEPWEEAYAAFVIPEDVNVYVDTLKEGESSMKMYQIRGHYAEYNSSPDGVKKIEVRRTKREKTVFFVLR